MSENTTKVERQEDQKTEVEGSEATAGAEVESEQKNVAEETSDEENAESPDTPSVEEFAKLKAEYEERYDRMLRTVAEFENSKKRAEREKEEFLKYALESFVKDLVPAIDSIERAIDSTNESKDFDALIEGVKMIHKQLLNSFEKRGVMSIKAVGESFDPTQHEAVVHVESDEVPENKIIQEWQRGYVLHNRVIRPSMVSVSKGKGKAEEASDE